MLKIEHRQLHRPNGLIDDFVLYGEPVDYATFAAKVDAAIESRIAETLKTESRIQIEVLAVDEQSELFTSLQNKDDCYLSMEDWQQRDILRVLGSTAVLEKLRQFLIDLSGRGQGYSYISDYSADCPYSACSPQWRLHR